VSTYISSVQTPSQTYYFPYDDHRWTIYGGAAPKVQRWRVPADTARKVMNDLQNLSGQAREVTIAFGEPDNLRHVYRVIVLGTEPAENLQYKWLLLTDVRWYLTFAWMLLDINVRRRLGGKRLVGPDYLDSIPADNVGYAPWSISGDKAFKWDGLRDKVLNFLTYGKNGRPTLAWTADSFHKMQVPTEAVQEATTDGDGVVSLSRMIETIPGAGIYVDLAGMIHVYERVPGAESDIIEQIAAAFPDLWGNGTIAFVDYGPVRPKQWLVYLDLEIELPLKYDPTATWAKDDPFLEPVLKVTDYTLTVEGTQMAAGSWITQDKAFVAWGGATYGTLTLPQLTDDIVANHWAGKGLDHYTIGNTFMSFDPVWGKRISELKNRWRTYFRVNPVFWEKVRHAWATRVAVWDPVTGTRAASPVFCNYAVMPVGALEMASVNASTQVYFFGKNITDYPNSGSVGDAKPSGFGLVLVDEELGIFAIERSTDKFPGQQVIFPSPIVGLAGLQNDGAALSDGNLQQLDHLTGARPWKLMTVVSVAPASPNDLRRVYCCKVQAAEAALAAGLTFAPRDGTAPDKETRTQMAVARIGYRDDQRDLILNMISGNTDVDPSKDPVSSVDPINLETEVRPQSKATAAQELMAVLDRFEGKVSIPFSPSVVPLGSIQRVTHRVSADRLMTDIECTGEEPPFNAADFLHGAARSFLLKEIASAR
jgi:hypothetical protein